MWEDVKCQSIKSGFNCTWFLTKMTTDKRFPMFDTGVTLSNLLLHILIHRSTQHFNSYHTNPSSDTIVAAVPVEEITWFGLGPMHLAAKLTILLRLSLLHKHLLPLPVFLLQCCSGEMVGPIVMTSLLYSPSAVMIHCSHSPISFHTEEVMGNMVAWTWPHACLKVS